MLNILTIDVEDYFQVHAFSNVIKVEDWGNYESRIERNTFRILEILHECVGPNNSTNSSNPINSSNPSNSTNPSNPTSNLYPQDFNFVPPTSNLKPRSSPKATFFCLGWIAERYPNLIRTIKKEGHEIASHGYNHRLIYNMTPEKFREDVRKSKEILEDIVGDEVIGYRAPSYSITNKSQWAFEVLMEEGFKYDSSIFPIHHDFYGFPHAPRFPFLISMDGSSDFKFQILNLITRNPKLVTRNTEHGMNSTNSSNPTNPSNPSNLLNCSTAALQHFSTRPSPLATRHSLLEFPLSTVRILGTNWPVAGGGYFRLFPYSIIKKGLTRINRIEGMPFIFYLHPWELDDEQLRINSTSMLSKFRHYVNLDKTETRFRRLLMDFDFSSIREIMKLK
jgi:polysaccharide deacetylase family protein (PEP-CTERM system associated)